MASLMRQWFQRARDDAGILQKCAEPWGYHCVFDPRWTHATCSNQYSNRRLEHTKELSARSIRDRKEIKKMGLLYDFLCICWYHAVWDFPERGILIGGRVVSNHGAGYILSRADPDGIAVRCHGQAKNQTTSTAGEQ
jgi:hypothetical protein